ncbi:hypothetical protein [Spiroplasma endosymbiont of Aspidapion aeneum]|uniref:hypothetical protein n=1 Tax=Spiroplasma endosymbiont of Aspidapion aeneum TaxID=3066276 RepID=UPI00313A89B9
MKKYFIISNDYELTKLLKIELLKQLDKLNWIEDEQSPDFVFSLGGDGSFLKTFRKYKNIIESVKIIPIKSGGVGYYTYNNTSEDVKKISNLLLNEEYLIIDIELLELEYVASKKIDYVVNEIKVYNSVHPAFIDISIDGTLLQRFQGTGIVFSTSTGSGGFMRSSGGSIILPKNNGIWQYNEYFPVSTINYRSLGSSLILSKNNEVEIKLDPQEHLSIVLDANFVDSKESIIKIRVSDKKAKVCCLQTNKNNNEVKTLSSIFTKKRNY